MTKLKKHKINLVAAIITMVGLLILTSISCKSPTTPEATEASITITNHCGIAVDILMDGVWQLTIEHLQSSTLSIPTLGVYEYEARKQGTGTLQRTPYGEHLLEATKSGETDVIASITLDITENIQYTWTITK